MTDAQDVLALEVLRAKREDLITALGDDLMSAARGSTMTWAPERLELLAQVDELLRDTPRGREMRADAWRRMLGKSA